MHVRYPFFNAKGDGYFARFLRAAVVEDQTSVPAFDAKPAVVLANGSAANIDSAIAELLLNVM